MKGLSIAIVGSGPSGCFLAQALKRSLPSASIDMIERLPVPFGLIRYGVAPDHQGTKAITRQFERLFEREDVQFWGGVEIGRSIALDELRTFFDVVVLATGLRGDRLLGIPGRDLPGVIGSGRMTRWLNSHPDEAQFTPAIGPHVVIIGNGNVALDLARLLAKSRREFAGSDIAPERLEQLQAASIRQITVIGRGMPAAARFDTGLLKELAKLEQTHVRVCAPQNSLLPAGDAASAAQHKAIMDLDGTGAEAASAHKTLTFRFGLSPAEIVGGDRVRGVRLVQTNNGADAMDIAADTVLTAIGFDDDPSAQFTRSGLRIDCAAPIGQPLSEGLFAVGWLKRGPRGTIPDNRVDAKSVADAITAKATALLARGQRPGREAFAARVASDRVTDYASWQVLRDLETAKAPEGRVRLKFPTIAAMRSAIEARQQS